MKEKFGTPRRTELAGNFEQDIEALIQREDMVTTVTNGGYIKRVPLVHLSRADGAAARAGPATGLKEEDFVSDLFVASTHTPLLIFHVPKGIVHKMKVWQLPLGDAAIARQGAGQSAAAVGRRKHFRLYAPAGR